MMTDELVIEARKGGPCAELGDRCRAIEAASGCFCAAVADRIEALTAERDEAINQLDSAIHSQIVLEKRTAAVMEDRKFILEERDRTFALMLARAEKAELERDALREDVEELDFLRHEGGPDSVAAIEAERDRLRHAIMFWLEAEEPDVDAAINMMRAALKGETP